MVKFTDIFIEKPVVAVVISLLILIVGLRSYLNLQVREYPKLENTVITVTTAYPGANANLIQGFITTPLEKKIAGAEGIDYMISESRDGISVIQVFLELNFNPDDGFTNVMSKVQETLRDLPREAEQPSIRKVQGTGFSLMYIGFRSETLSLEQITDYIVRVVQPKLSTVPGTAEARILSQNIYAMRIWLNTDKMSGFGVTADDVLRAIERENVQAAAGKTRSNYIQVSIIPNTDLFNADEFSNMIVRTTQDGTLVKLRDIAKVELGSENYDTDIIFDGKRATFMAISVTPKANPLDVIALTRAELKKIKANLPETIQLEIVYDATEYIQASITEVLKTILEATLIVIIVIYLFLGTLRSVIIPIVAIPLSLIGVLSVMLFMGYSINLLTLLALVLAIGMVVDDAIVVVENIFRHIEDGERPFDAAIKGTREIAMPIIAMTITLAAVYSPIVFMSGITGALFKEFAFTLASAVIISGIIALTLSPMMCSKVLTQEIGRHKFVHFLEDFFLRLDRLYEGILEDILHYKPVIVFFAFFVLLSCLFLYMNSKKELAPTEDRGFVIALGLGPQTATLEYMTHFSDQLMPIFEGMDAKLHYFIINGTRGGNPVPNQSLFGMRLKPWDERTITQNEAKRFIQAKANQIPGLRFQVFQRPSIPVGGLGVPIQFEITSTLPLRDIYPYALQIIGKGMRSGQFLFLATNIKFDKPELIVAIDRAKAAQLGVSMASIANTLATAYGENYVNWFSMENRNYRVIPQVAKKYRSNPKDISDLYVRTGSNVMIPMSTFTTLEKQIQPNRNTRFQQQNSIEIIGAMANGNTLGDGLDYLRNVAKEILPSEITIDYAGESRQYVQEGGGIILTFFFAIIIIYLVLAEQFENFRDPLVILISVPMAISGALIAIILGFGGLTINIYTQVGLITLIGLITKHGILIVEFANQLQRRDNLPPEKAIVKAAGIRLRPVLMTAFSMIFGVMPLLLSAGPGAVSRFNIGLVIATGMFIGTFFTLIVVPTMYTLKTSTILMFLLSVSIVGTIAFMLFY